MGIPKYWSRISPRSRDITNASGGPPTLRSTLVLAAVGLAALVPLASSSGGQGSLLPSHSPILIDHENDLLLPDAISGNGVRRGSGTALDPYILEGWSITVGNQHAIEIRGVSTNLIIRNIEIRGLGPQAAEFSGIYLSGAGGILIESLVATELNTAIVAVLSDFVVANSTLRNITLQKLGDARAADTPTAIYSSHSELTVRGLLVENAAKAIVASNGRISITDSRILNVTDGIEAGAAGGGANSLRIEDVTIEGRDQIANGTSCDFGSLPGNTPVSRGLNVGARDLQAVSIQNVRIKGMTAGLIISANDPIENSQLPTVRVEDSTISGAACGLVSAGAGSRTTIRGNTIVDNNMGVLVGLEECGIRVDQDLRENVIARNTKGIDVHHEPCHQVEYPGLQAKTARYATRIHRNDIADNRDFALRYNAQNAKSYSSNYRANASGNYWGGDPQISDEPSYNAVTSNTIVEPHAKDSFTGYVSAKPPTPATHKTPAPGAGWALLAVVVLCGVRAGVMRASCSPEFSDAHK